MELRHLRYFLTLANELHFSKAAEKLCIVQPALSRQIKDLENDLGFLLFERNKRNVKLTLAGEFFKKEIETIFNNLENAKQNSKQISDGLSGEVRIGYVGSAAYNVIPELVSLINNKFPKAQLFLYEENSAQQIEQLKNGQLDICFIRNATTEKSIAKKTMTKDTFSLVFSSSHWLSHKKMSSLKELKNERFILPPEKNGEEYHAIILSILNNAGFNPLISHETSHAGTILKLVENNLGVSLLPSFFKNVATEKVKFIELSKIPQRSILSAIWMANNTNMLIKGCIELLTDLKSNLQI